jgi:hypothetical protein
MGVHVSKLPEDAPEWVLKFDWELHIAKCTSIAALSIAAYDWFACLDEEVDLICESTTSPAFRRETN